ncbi:helix-turn-helix domain-containing protein [Sphingobacterium alkalisoli]|uniref:Helix-turn-helix domain-containing protein n=1 Tax=Sphingobacterium alkalisoli TaxID=1874115 RepID=A0A4U0H4U2_9SPHI|nr:AraC family transcriptional regulator [Sphingobacterium alkalisoli]TJY66628.1 helix-turn-helix domain-containing protein [Sphingobacterium alkalisoli]GGH15228.1 AraC family transcriptional regulator [Sphingobacterium alkalisoli]
MPKVQIATLPCIQDIKDGDIEIRLFGQFNTEIHFHEKVQLVSPEMGTVYLYSEKGNFCIPAGHYAYISSCVNHKLVSRSHNLKLKTIFLDMCDDRYISDMGAITIFPPSSLLDNLLAFGEQYWLDNNNYDLKVSGLSYLKKVLPYILTSPLKLYTQPPQSEALLRVAEHIASSLNENITISSISTFINIPQRTLSRLFKSETGMTIFQFIKLSRMQMALELMEDKSLNINEIVYRIGYESTSTFSNLFKQLMGTSPQKYRQDFLTRHGKK